MSVFAADDFNVIRSRMLELRADKERAAKRCQDCGEPCGGHHEPSCRFTGVIIESETA